MIFYARFCIWSWNIPHFYITFYFKQVELHMRTTHKHAFSPYCCCLVLLLPAFACCRPLLPAAAWCCVLLPAAARCCLLPACYQILAATSWLRDPGYQVLAIWSYLERSLYRSKIGPKVYPPKVPQNRSRKKRATGRHNQANGSQTGAQI